MHKLDFPKTAENISNALETARGAQAVLGRPGTCGEQLLSKCNVPCWRLVGPPSERIRVNVIAKQTIAPPYTWCHHHWSRGGMTSSLMTMHDATNPVCFVFSLLNLSHSFRFGTIQNRTFWGVTVPWRPPDHGHTISINLLNHPVWRPFVRFLPKITKNQKICHWYLHNSNFQVLVWEFGI